ncbi:MAG: hypothetical protein O8C64_03960 [Candidatus Methanoperedens sp.]|nr:hypothetical protein [Candidatus Methanoperedens sp.]
MTVARPAREQLTLTGARGGGEPAVNRTAEGTTTRGVPATFND